MAFNKGHYGPAAKQKAKLQLYEHFENSKTVTIADCQADMTVSGDYAQYCSKFIRMFFKSKITCKSHLRLI